MKLIDNILNNYFSKLLVKEIINSIKRKFDIDICVDTILSKKSSSKVVIKAKPKYYENYTDIYDFYKKDAFYELIELINHKQSPIVELVDRLNKDGAWHK